MVSCSSVQVRLLLSLAAQLSVKSAVALSSSPVHVFVLLLSGRGGAFSLFNCLRCTSVDLSVVLLPLIQSSRTKQTNKQKEHRLKQQQQNPNPAATSNKKGSVGRKRLWHQGVDATRSGRGKILVRTCGREDTGTQSLQLAAVSVMAAL